MVIAPMYLTEIAPVKHRGTFGTLAQLGVVSTILLSQVKTLTFLSLFFFLICAFSHHLCV